MGDVAKDGRFVLELLYLGPQDECLTFQDLPDFPLNFSSDLAILFL
jgi:hypothetical protein